MYDPEYYREQARKVRRLARGLPNIKDEQLLLGIADDLEEIVVDLETGAVEIRHPELMPQTRNA